MNINNTNGTSLAELKNTAMSFDRASCKDVFIGDFDKLKDAKECAILNSVEKDDSYILKRTTTIRERKIRVIKR